MPGPDPDNDQGSSSGGGWSSVRSAAKAAGRSLTEAGKSETDRAGDIAQSIRPVQYKRGGKVRKTGMAGLHKGERVIPRGKVKGVERMMKKSKMRMKARG